MSPLELLAKRDDQVEVHSWKHQFNQTLKRWAAEYGQAIELDPVFPEITFVRRGREAKPVGNVYKKLGLATSLPLSE